MNNEITSITKRDQTFGVVKILDDSGFAIFDDARDMRIDVFPPIPKAAKREPKHAGPTVHVFSGPFITPAQARAYAVMLEAAADYADTLVADCCNFHAAGGTATTRCLESS